MKNIKHGNRIVFVFLSLLLISSGFRAADKAPEFSANASDGSSIKLKDLRGQIVLLDFWATWCPPCRAEVPNMVELSNSFKNRNLTIIGISLDRDPEAARKFVSEKKMEWLHVIGMPQTGPIADLYQVFSIPATFIIDGNGIIVAQGLRGAELKARIASLLK